MTDVFRSPEFGSQELPPGLFLGRVGHPEMEKLDDMFAIHAPNGAVGLPQSTVMALARRMADDTLSIAWIDPATAILDNRIEKQDEQIEIVDAIKGHLSLNISSRLVCIDGSEMEIPYLEFSTLEALIRKPGVTLDREYFLTTIWGLDNSENISVRTVDTHIKRLRTRLGIYSPSIHTVRGVGYRFDPSFPYEQE